MVAASSTSPNAANVDTPHVDFCDLETPHRPHHSNDNDSDDGAVVANALEPHSSAAAVCVGVFLAIGLLLVGYTDGLNSIISVAGFTVAHCTRTSVSPVGVVTKCATVDDHWFRLAYTFGSVLGPLLGGFALADRLDRKWTLLVGALVSIAGGAWAIGTPNSDLVQPVIARGVQGVGASILAFGIPLLMVEIASKRSRGLIGAVLFLGLYIGVFAWAVLKLSDHAEELRRAWQVLYVIPMVLATVVGIGAVTAQTSEPPRRSLLESYTLKRVGIAFVLLTAQQFFALANLAQLSDVFEDLRESLSDTEIRYMSTSDMLRTGFNSNNGFVAFVVALPAIISFCVIDKAGRRLLLLSGALLIGLSQTTVKFSMDSCKGEIFARSCGNNGSGLLVIFQIAFFGLSWGPVCIIYPFELFPTEVRARGTALALAASTAVVMLVKEFYVELCFNAIALVAIPVLAFVVVALWCPETKRLALEDAEKLTATRGLCSLN